MKKNTVAIILVAAAIGTYYYSKGSAGAKLNVVASNAKNLKIVGISVEFDLELTISNPTNQNISVNGLGGYCYVNNTIIAPNLKNERFTIERYAATKILVPTRLQFSGTFYSINQVVAFFKGTPLTLAWKGEARTLGLSIPLETQFVINRKTALV